MVVALDHIFFQNEAGDSVTVNSEQYRHKLTIFWGQFWMCLINKVCDSSKMVTCHTAYGTIAILQEKFAQMKISRNATDLQESVICLF